MRSSRLARKLLVGVLLLFLVPTVVAGAAVVVLYHRGVFGDPFTLAVMVGVGFAAMMGYLGIIAHSLGRALVRSLEQIRLGTELMATVNPDHRLRLRTGDELELLAAEINRMADCLRDARSDRERDVVRATSELEIERGKLSAVLESLGEGVTVATLEGTVILANRAAHELVGSSPGGLLARSLFEFVDREKVAHFIARLLRRGSAVERFSLQVGGRFFLKAVMTPFFDRDRRPQGFVLVLRDVTSPVRSSEERERLLTATLLELRGLAASLRSLSESLLAQPSPLGASDRLVTAIHAEARRLSEVIARTGTSPGLARVPSHFETIAVTDLLAMTLRRVAGGVAAAREAMIDAEANGPPSIRGEVAALSEALAHLVRAVSARRVAPGPVTLRPRQRGRVIVIEIGTDGTAPVAELEQCADTEASLGAAGQLTVRQVTRDHAGEVWAFADEHRFGFRLTLPLEDAGEGSAAAEAEARPRVSFVGAGLVSGAAGEEGGERPDSYDFSLFDEMDRQLPVVDRERRLDQLTGVVIDTETTGLRPDDGDRIVSIAAVKVRNGAVKRGEIFDALVKPGRSISPASTRFHGITDATVAQAPPLEVVLPAFVRFADGATLIGHQVWFDLRFITLAAERLGLPFLGRRAILDTVGLSEIVHGPLEQHGLEAIADRLGVVVRGRHSALGDALTTAEIFVRLVELLKGRGICTLGEALDATRRVRRR